MSSDQKVTQWLPRLAAGDEEAARELFLLYFARMVRLARVKLGGGRHAVRDEEDIAQSAYKSFWQGLRDGTIPHLPADRHQLWGLLAVITVRKVYHTPRDAQAVHEPPDDQPWEPIGREPSPEQDLVITDTLDRLLTILDKHNLRPFAERHLKGLTTKEIAAECQVSAPTVRKKLELIHRIWEQELSHIGVVVGDEDAWARPGGCLAFRCIG